MAPSSHTMELREGKEALERKEVLDREFMPI
jgi:hypothetical protein